MPQKKENCMNQSDLIAQCAEKLEKTKTEMKQIIDGIADVILENLKKKDFVTFSGLGKFVVKEAKARACRNPRTGVKMELAAKTKFAFSPSTAAKTEIENIKS